MTPAESTGLQPRIAPATEVRGITRRGALKGGAGTALAAGLTSGLARSAWARPSPPVLTRSPLLVLHNRATNGFNGEEWAVLNAVGATPAAYRNYLLQTTELTADTRADAYVAPFGLWLDATPEGVLSLDQLQTKTVLRLSQVGRALYSRNQLHERMYEFWTDHFSTFLDQDGAAFWGPSVIRDVTRRFGLTERDAMGTIVGPSSFPKILRESARNGAMLWYLDNWKSRLVPGINENYGRELLELHTLGTVDPTIPNSPANYSQADVVAAARIMTGWRFYFPGDPGLIFPPGGNFGQFNFFGGDHINGPHTVLGHIFDEPSNRENEGLFFLDFLSDPAFGGGKAAVTAKYLGYKLLRWFIEYDPTSAEADAVKNVYLTSNGDLKAVVDAVLSDANLNRVSTQGKLKLRRPAQLALALLRAVDRPSWDTSTSPWKVLSQAYSPTGLGSYLAAMGNEPYAWPSPDGYPDSVESWSEGMFSRWTFCHKFFERTNNTPGIPGVEIDDTMLARLLTNGSQTSLSAVPLGTLGATIDGFLTGGVMATADVAAVQALVNELTNNPSTYPGVTLSMRIRLACSLAAASPSFQYY